MAVAHKINGPHRFPPYQRRTGGTARNHGGDHVRGWPTRQSEPETSLYCTTTQCADEYEALGEVLTEDYPRRSAAHCDWRNRDDGLTLA
jgi:hypothetical protein